MAAGTPLNRLVLVARSVADDLGYAALADVVSETIPAEVPGLPPSL